MISRAAGTLTILRHWPGQRRVPFERTERVAARRDARLRSTIGYAAAHVPYYRDLFRSTGIDPGEIRTTADLERLPLLDKQTVREHETAFRSPAIDRDDGLWLRTAGSRTGIPFSVFHDRESLLATIAFAERERMVEARLCGRKLRYSAVEIRFGGAELWKLQAYYAEHAFRPVRPGRHGLSVDTPLDKIVTALDRLRPDVVRSYCSYLETLARFVEGQGQRWHRPAVLVYGGDALPAAARAAVESSLDAPLVSRYGASEAPKVAYSCEERTGFHLYEDVCHVEIVDEHGRPVPPGTEGEVVITNLVNRGTILLRYRLEDRARLTTEPCACGRSGPRLAEIDGRVGYAIRLPDGSHVHGYSVWELVNGVPGLLRFQLAQLEPDRFVLRLQMADEHRFTEAREAVLPRLRGRLPGCGVEVVEVPGLGPDANGKYRWVVPLT